MNGSMLYDQKLYIMKKLCIILSMLFICMSMYGQEPQVVVLKDGTVIKGTVENLSDGGVRVTNEYGDIFEYSAEEVSYTGEELTERQMKRQQKTASARDYSAPMRGYKLFLETGAGAGFIRWMYYDGYRKYSCPMLMFHVINGYSFSQYLYVGGGVGVNFGGGLYVPIYAHVRSSFLKKRVSPFVAASAGYSIAAGIFSGISGSYLNGGLGICVKKRKKGEVWLSLNYEKCGNFSGLLFKAGYSF